MAWSEEALVSLLPVRAARLLACAGFVGINAAINLTGKVTGYNVEIMEAIGKLRGPLRPDPFISPRP